MHKHVEWDTPGQDSVVDHYAKSPNHHPDPGPGDVLSARLNGIVVRVKVEAYVDGTSIGDVVAMIHPRSGERMESYGKLTLGDIVRLPDEKRAFEPQPIERDDRDNDD